MLFYNNYKLRYQINCLRFGDYWFLFAKFV